MLYLIAVRENFIAYKIDIDQFSGMDIAERYKIEQYPTLLVTDARGIQKHKAIGYQSSEQLYDMIKSYNRNR